MNAFFLLFFASYGIYALFHNITFWLIYIILICVYYFITEHSLGKGINDFIRRKISIATWSNSFDPQMYTDFKLDITKIEPYLEKKSQELSEKITLTIFSIKLMSIVLKKHPEIYGYIKFGKYMPKEGVDICCLVQVGDGKELANTTIKNCENKSFVDISRELKENVALLRKRKNKDQVKKMNLMKMFPTW